MSWEVLLLADVLWVVLLLEDVLWEVLLLGDEVLLYLKDIFWEILLFDKVWEFDCWVMNHPCQVFVYSVL